MGFAALKISEALRDVNHLYFDTAPLIYYLEQNPPFVARMELIMAQADSAQIRATTSVLTLTEILVQPLKVGNTDHAQDLYDAVLDRFGNGLATVTSEIALSAAAIRARHELRTPDALHLATTLRQGCDAFLTNDSHFKRVRNLRILDLDELEL